MNIDISDSITDSYVTHMTYITSTIFYLVLQRWAPGTCVFGAAGLHSAMEAFRASKRSTNRYFFGFVASAFLTAATWRAVTPTVPVHH